MEPLRNARRVKAFSGDTDLVPGVGYVKPADQGYQWIPINYSALNK